MATLKELRDERLRKLDQLKALGINPFPAESKRTHQIGDILEKISDNMNKPATLTGRVIGIRKFGKIKNEAITPIYH